MATVKCHFPTGNENYINSVKLLKNIYIYYNETGTEVSTTNILVLVK